MVTNCVCRKNIDLLTGNWKTQSICVGNDPKRQYDAELISSGRTVAAANEQQKGKQVCWYVRSTVLDILHSHMMGAQRKQMTRIFSSYCVLAQLPFFHCIQCRRTSGWIVLWVSSTDQQWERSMWGWTKNPWCLGWCAKCLLFVWCLPMLNTTSLPGGSPALFFPPYLHTLV